MPPTGPTHSAEAVLPTAAQTRVETLLPAVARWVGREGYIAIRCLVFRHT